MKPGSPISGLVLLVAMTSLAGGRVSPIPESSVQAAFAEKKGAFVLVDCLSQSNSTLGPQAASEKLPPCSTFTIWNTLKGEYTMGKDARLVVETVLKGSGHL